jgi:hypothetical protein
MLHVDVANVLRAMAVLSLLLVFLTGKPLHPSPSVEHFRAAYAQLVGLRAVVGKAPSADASVVSIVVDKESKLKARIEVPWAGRPLSTVLPRLQSMFGRGFVVSSADVVRKDSGKVVVVYGKQSLRVVKVVIPKRWSVSPEYLPVPLDTKVTINPRNPGATKGLRLSTNSRGVILEAVYSS